MWPLSRHPDLIPRGEAFMKKWGVLGIFIGRFFGPLRASVPLIAGIFEMPFWQFQIANFSSAFVWAATLFTIGDVISKMIALAVVMLEESPPGFLPGETKLKQLRLRHFGAGRRVGGVDRLQLAFRQDLALHRFYRGVAVKILRHVE